MTTILAMETSANACSTAVWCNGAVVAQRHRDLGRGHSEALFGMVREVLGDAALAVSAMDLIAVTVGPGAFTGLRIGLAAARGMALAARVPVLGVTAFDALAAAVPPAETADRTILVAIESKRDDVYVQAFGGDGERAPAAVLAAAVPAYLGPLAELPVVVVGDAAGRVTEALAAVGIETLSPARPLRLDAGVVARLAAARSHAGGAPVRPVPLYLRPPDAVPARHGGRLRP